MKNLMMKNAIYLVLIILISFSCSKNDEEETFILDESSNIEIINTKNAAITYRFYETYGSCNDDSLDNSDLEVLFSEPLEQDAIFTFWV